MFKYFVVVDDPNDKDQVHEELMNDGGSNFIPSRPVDCHNPLSGSLHNGLFWLTPDEAKVLKLDPRVRDVHRIPEEIGIFPKIRGSRSGTYDKNGYTVTTSMRNWALSRCINTTDNFGGGTAVSSPYTYNLDGTGVDVIVMDTGVEKYHPEFAVNPDGTGGTRVIDLDWTQYGYLTTPTGGFLGDCDGHGSNVASIIAGNTHGWASNANIYSLRAIGTGASPEKDITTGATLGLVDVLNAWYTIYAFHTSKSVDPKTGHKRPTVVNCSFGYYTSYANITSVNYRGVTHSITTTSGLYGMIGTPQYGVGTHGYRYTALDADIQQAINAGVIVVGSAGNDYHKIDLPTGLDYNNYWVDNSSNHNYYHQGATPGSTPGVICVGAVSTSTAEHKIYFSCTGPRVDIFAPGVNIMGAFSSSTYTQTCVDTRSSVSTTSNYTYYLDKISGTSQASPNVAGVVSCLVQARPWMTATQVLNFLTSVSAKNQLSESYYSGAPNGVAGTYTNFGSLQGAGNNFLYLPFNQSYVMETTTGTLKLATIG
jgi:Subtilase family